MSLDSNFPSHLLQKVQKMVMQMPRKMKTGFSRRTSTLQPTMQAKTVMNGLNKHRRLNPSETLEDSSVSRTKQKTGGR